jgi:arsenate reductase (glutaredoxin)
MHDMSTTSVQLFGLTKSKTTRKAQRFFSDRRIPVHFVDCKVRPPAPGELKRWVQRFGAEALLDPDSKSYKEQGLQYVSASDDDWIGRMAAIPRSSGCRWVASATSSPSVTIPTGGSGWPTPLG